MRSSKVLPQIRKVHLNPQAIKNPIPNPLPSLSSVSFSGAGFLGCYHLGVAHCLTQHKILPSPGELPTPSTKTLLGCSAGSIVAAGVSAGINPETDGMDITLQVLKRTKLNTFKLLDSLTPGFSLIDQVEGLLLDTMKKYMPYGNDEEYFLRRIDNGKLLRVYLTHTKSFFTTRQSNDMNYPHYPPSLHYIDEYRGIEDVVAACMLSSYIPGATGPLSAEYNSNKTVQRSNQRLKSLLKYNPTSLKDSFTNKPILDPMESYWDGGLVNNWPIIDHTTLVVSPLHGDYSPNSSISPEWDDDDSSVLPKYIKWHGYKINLHSKNIDALFRMILSSDESVLQQKFNDGYDDTK